MEQPKLATFETASNSSSWDQEMEQPNRLRTTHPIIP
jgi:hypothetical protein